MAVVLLIALGNKEICNAPDFIGRNRVSKSCVERFSTDQESALQQVGYNRYVSQCFLHAAWYVAHTVANVQAGIPQGCYERRNVLICRRVVICRQNKYVYIGVWMQFGSAISAYRE